MQGVLQFLRIDYMKLNDDKPGYIADVINASIKDPASVEIHRKLREPMMMLTDWEGDSALCPRCGEKAIIADAQGFPITDNFMSIAHDYWI